MIDSLQTQTPLIEGLFDRVVRQHVELYCLILALLTIAAIALLH